MQVSRLRKLQFCCLALLAIGAALSARAQSIITVSDCPGQTLPLKFEVDCTHVSDPSTRAQCKPFAQNQACKVFFAYRAITGIHLEDTCAAFRYTIYDDDRFPHPKGEGGVALHCAADYTATPSLKIASQIGPYDVHEMLHVYQDSIGAIPYQHMLFGPSMAEARRRVGDNKGYWNAMTELKQETMRMKLDLEKGSVAPDQRCLTAELFTQNDLYIRNPANVELFYRKLEPGRQKDMDDRLRRFARMFNVVSSGSTTAFLARYCPAF